VLNDRFNDIRRLVDLRLGGYSNIQIARKLNEEGFRSPIGLEWTAERVRLYLAPDKLLLLQGHFVYGQKKDEGDPRRIIVHNAFPAVISQEEAEAIQAFNDRQREVWATGNPRKAARTSYIPSGLIRCSQCGSPFRFRTSGRPMKTHCVCTRAYTNTIPHPVGVSISGEVFKDAVLRAVREAVEDYREQAEQGTAPKATPTSANAQLEKQIAKINDGITKVSQLYESGRMQLEDFDRRYKELVVEREQLRGKLSHSASQSAMQSAVEQAVADAADGGLTTETARRLILAFVERIEAPVEAETPNGNHKPRKCRAAWVTLKQPMRDGTRRILTPFHSNSFTGQRVLLDRE
jgi:hypothetical protein